MSSYQGRTRLCQCLDSPSPLDTRRHSLEGELETGNKNKTSVNRFGAIPQIPRSKSPKGCQKRERYGDTAIMEDERYSEDSSDVKKSDGYASSSDKIKKRLESLAKERDCAVEMWNLAKEAADAKREEAMKWAAEAEKLAFRMEEMQKDYSEAIKLMERKVELLESELGKVTARNEMLETELKTVKENYQDVKCSLMKSSSEFEEILKERNDLKESLDQTKDLLHQAEKVSIQARDKVTDALSMAQDALANEASITEEEKARLEDAMAEILTAAEQKLAKEVEKTRREMENKVSELQSQLHTLTIEKNRVCLENDSVKSEFRVRHNQAMDKTKTLHHELDELRSKRQSDLVQWHDERDSLRRQVASLQSDTEALLAQLRRRQLPCPDCKEQKTQVDRYRKLAKKWEETADGVTQNFEKYLKEAKEAYIMTQGKRPEIPVGKT